LGIGLLGGGCIAGFGSLCSIKPGLCAGAIHDHVKDAGWRGQNETAGEDVTDIVGEGIVRDRRVRLKLPSSQDAVSVLVLVFCGVLVLYPMLYLVVLSVNVGDPQTFPPDEYGIEHYRDLFESWRVIANTAFVASIATV